MEKDFLEKQINDSALPSELKEDAKSAIRQRIIIPGQEALQCSLLPHTITSGSFDPATYGHLFLVKSTLDIDPDAGIVITATTWKSPEYQLFSPVVRAAFLRSYGIHAPIILGDTDDPSDRLKLLTLIHQKANRIIKGRRTDEDTKHTHSLAPKYNIPLDHFFEIQSPPELEDISSGQLKGLLYLQHCPPQVREQYFDPKEIEQNLKQIADYTKRAVSTVVLQCTEKTIQSRTHEENEIYLKRLIVGSSEKLFAEKKKH